MKNFLIVIFFIAIFLPFRLYHLDYPLLDAFNFRQTQTATIALNFYKNGIDLFKTEIDIAGIGRERFLTLEFPLYQAIVTILYKSFFFHELWGRVVSISAGFIAALYLYKLVRLILRNDKLAVLSSFFFLAVPLNLFYQRSFMIEPTIIAVLLIGLYHYCQWVLKRDRLSFFASLIFLTLGFVQKGLYGPFWLLPMTVLYIKKYSLKRVFDFRFLIIALFPLLVLFFWQDHINRLNTQSGHYFFTSYNLGHLEWNFGTLRERFLWPLWEFKLKQVLNGLFLKPGLLFFMIGFLTLYKKDKYRFFYCWIFSQIVYFVVLFRIQQQNYYQLIITPITSVFIAYGLLSLVNWFKKAVFKNLVIAVVCSIFLLKSWQATLPSFAIDWGWYKQFVKAAEILPETSYGILVTPGVDWNSVYTYYTKRKMKQVTVEQLTPESIEAWKKEGYSFIMLYDYSAYGSSLPDLRNYPHLLTTSALKIYLLN